MAKELIDGDDWMTAATPGKLADGGGLYLDVRSASSASWLYRFKLGGKPDEVGLGSRAKVDIDRARELRRWCELEVLELRNPKTTLKTRKEAVAAAVNAPKAKTVHETARDNVGLIAQKLKTERGQKAWVRSMHADVIGPIADMAPAEVTEDHVLALLTPLYMGVVKDGKVVQAPTPIMADDIRQRLSKLLGWACRRVPGWSNPVVWKGALEHDLKRKDKKDVKHHAALPAFRVGKFLATLREREENALAMRLALEWHVVSASRPGEAVVTDWAWFDWANECVTYPAEVMKMRRPHRVPLTTRHNEILDLILAGAEPPEAGPVFSVNGADAVSVTGIRRVLQAVDKTGATLHGFRSSFATWARAETYPVTLPTGEVRKVRLYDEALIEECLAHVVGDETRNAYVRDDFLELRRPAMQAWATYCGKVLEASEVTQIRRRPAVKLAA